MQIMGNSLGYCGHRLHYMCANTCIHLWLAFIGNAFGCGQEALLLPILEGIVDFPKMDGNEGDWRFNLICTFDILNKASN